MDSPGTADLTAHVDFGELYKIAIDNGVAVFGPVTQSAFLSSLGIHTRAKALAKASPKNANEIFEALARLTSDDSMGALFKVLVLTSPGMIPPPGFE